MNTEGTGTEAILDSVRRVKDVSVAREGDQWTVSLQGRAVAYVSEDAKGPVVRYYEDRWRYTRETGVVMRLVRRARRDLKSKPRVDGARRPSTVPS